MARVRFFAVALLALALAGNSNQTGKTAEQKGGSPSSASSSVPSTSPSSTSSSVPNTSWGYAFGSANVSAADSGPCKIYALADMGFDPDFGSWIAQTIPSMIEPNSWREQGGSGVLSYYAPKNVLIVKNSPAIQSKVDGFLKDLKTSAVKGNDTNSAVGKKTSRASVVPAVFREPAAVLRTSQAVPETPSYPVPAPVKPPKHLFHFLIRYEGEGIIDDNVVKYMKAASQAEKSDKPEKETEEKDAVQPPGFVPPAPPIEP